MVVMADVVVNYCNVFYKNGINYDLWVWSSKIFLLSTSFLFNFSK